MESQKKEQKEKSTRDMRDKKYISFDWALKRLLRDKANFGVLEGFLTTLLNWKSRACLTPEGKRR